MKRPSDKEYLDTLRTVGAKCRAWAKLQRPDWMLSWLFDNRGMRLDESKLRLFACDCAEQVLPLFERDYPEDKRPRMAIEMARRFANGKATREELDAAWAAAMAAAWAAAVDAARGAAVDAARVAAMAAAWAAAADAAADAAMYAAMDAARAYQADKLRSYFPNPFEGAKP